MTDNEYGRVSAHSSARNVNFLAIGKDSPEPIVGKLVYFDMAVGDDIYRSVGTVTGIVTENTQFTAAYETMLSKTSNPKALGRDLRKTDFAIQAVFKKSDEGWVQYGASLPTSPSTNATVHLFSDDILEEMVAGMVYPTAGYMRGLEETPMPMNIRDFSGSAGSFHSGIIGKSGSGKSAMYSLVLGASMKHEHHAILVIDPQGQWSNENGSIFSPQALARSLGREVSVLRVSEDVQLPMDIDILGKMIDKTNLWAKFRRMGGENKEAFSNEVAERLAGVRKLDIDSRDLLTDAFSSIANSPSTLSRIYVKGERQDAFKRDLLMLAGEPIYLETGEEELIEADELADVEARWENILTAFKPLHSLFSKENLAGTKRRPLGGVNGFLTDIFKVRKNTDAPAPYVVLDMSPNVTLHAKAALDRSNSEYGMQKLLDNQDVKALILMMLLEEMKKASEVAFAEGGGNLNTQIVFDEAWRYAPASKASPEIDELAAMLEGFALDTRKFGIGWTYILQSPSDLRFGIWRQLTFVYSGYGLVGEDVRKLETLTDDVKQVDLYRQFISPASTGKYPFMITGPISPLIFTSSPSFINAFAGATEFLEHNQIWIDEITKRRSLPNVTEASLGAVQGQAQAAVKAAQRAAAASKAQTYQVGKVQAVTAPQTPVKVAPVITKPVFVDDDDLGDTPF